MNHISIVQSSSIELVPCQKCNSICFTHRQGIVACWYFQVPVGSSSYIMMTRTQTKWRLHVSESVKFIRRTLYEQTDDGSLIPWTGAPYPEKDLQEDIDSEPLVPFVTGYDYVETCLPFPDMKQSHKEGISQFILSYHLVSNSASCSTTTWCSDRDVGDC